MRNGPYGALPPPGMEWMMGRTVAEIDAILDEADETAKEPAEVAASEKWKIREPIQAQ